MSHSNADASRLLVDSLSLFNHTGEVTVLDLACGKGRNGLLLAAAGISVCFADRDQAALDHVAAALERGQLPGTCWLLDLEVPGVNPLAGKQFDAVLVFNYLHRPLMPAIKESINRGGLIFYETFTAAQAKLGRPTNPEFLLQPGELKSWFEDWELLHYSEGEQEDPRRAVASLVARRS